MDSAYINMGDAISLSEIIKNLPGYIYWKNAKSEYVGCNNNLVKVSGFNNVEEVVGKTDKDFYWGRELADDFITDDQEVMRSGQTKITEHDLHINPQEFIQVRTEKIPLYNQDGIPIGILAVALDISDRKKTERALVEAEHKLAGMTLVGASIAHEIRTPLQSVDAAIDSFKEYFPVLLEAYELIDKTKLTRTLKPSTINFLQNTLDTMRREIQLASLVINLLQENLVLEHTVRRGNSLPSEFFFIRNSVHEALERYPFKLGQRERINWQSSLDFKVQGKELLIIHILFNLLKNALHHIAVAENRIAGKKGEISIWLELGNPYNKLYFKDTGTGITADKLPRIFERFFTQTEHGAGIGLSYCKMAMETLKGSIICESVEGHYTLFILTFPHLVENSRKKR